MQPNQYLHALRNEANALQTTIDNLKCQKAAQQEAIQQLAVDVDNRMLEIDALQRSAAATERGYQAAIDILREQMATDQLLIEMKTAQVLAANAAVVALEATVDRLQGTIGGYSDQISQLSRKVVEQDAEIERLNREVLDQGVEYCHDFGVDPHFIDINDDLREDIHRAGAYLAPTVTITRQVVGRVMWVIATWQPPPMSNIDDNDNDITVLPRMTLRIEIDPVGYATSPTPPKLKITHVDGSGDDVEFPVGKRIANILVEYMRRCWGRSGFNPPISATSLHNTPPVSTTFSHDTDPRCAVPYVADEGGLITHLVRYAMLRMKTFADFCVVCDQPIQHNKGLVVTCGSDLCDYSFHEKGVGYMAVGLEATPSTAPGLKSRSKVPDYASSSEHVTVLMMTYVVHNLPTAEHNAWMCSSGSKGYCAVKEMLQNGTPGNALLIESGDLRDVDASSECEYCEGWWCLLLFITKYSMYSASSHIIPSTVKSAVVYTNKMTVPWYFLCGCTGLTTLNLSPLSQVTEIQTGFLQGCTGLTALDLSPLSRVVEVQGEFLQRCTGLTTIDLSPLSRAKFTGSLLSGCTGLTTLDLSPLSQVTEIYENFLSGCTGLMALDLSPLSHVTTFKWCFLMGCTGLTTLDLSPLSHVTELPEDFLEGCIGINAVDNPPPFCDPPKGWELVANQWVRGYPSG